MATEGCRRHSVLNKRGKLRARATSIPDSFVSNPGATLEELWGFNVFFGPHNLPAAGGHHGSDGPVGQTNPTSWGVNFSQGNILKGT